MFLFGHSSFLHRAITRPEQHLTYLLKSETVSGYFFYSPETLAGDYSLLHIVLLELNNCILYVVVSFALV